MDTKSFFRHDNRKPAELRPLEFVLDFAQAARGSVLVRVGNTHVLYGVSIEESVPRWMRTQKVGGGWLTAEYSMLPYSTKERTSRESTLGKVGGRTQEIQRLIGWALRAVMNLDKLGARTIWVDCDVIQADGGTRTAAITDAFVALRLALDRLMKSGVLSEDQPFSKAEMERILSLAKTGIETLIQAQETTIRP